jgi:hydrogenase expression/formation protein HypC
MCLALPVRVVEKTAGDGAIVDLGGIRKEISLALVDGVEVGDWVVLHVGYALAKLDPAEAERTLALFASAGDSSPFKGEVGRGMGLGPAINPSPPLPPPLEGEGERLVALTELGSNPSPPLSRPGERLHEVAKAWGASSHDSSPFKGEVGRGMGLGPAMKPSPPLSPPLGGEGKRSVALTEQGQ